MTEDARTLGHVPEAGQELERAEYYPVRLLIYGKPGTGQSVIARELARRSGLSLHRAGQEKRDEVRKATGEEIIGHHPIEVDENRRIDEDVEEWILAATQDSKVIIDAKLASVIFRELRAKVEIEGAEPLEGVGVLVVAKASVRYRRIRERQIGRHMRKTGLSREEIEKDPQFSLSAIKKATIEREQGDLEGWRLAHPQLVGVDPFNPANKDNQGHKIFDFHINTTNLSVNEGANLVEAILKSRYLGMQRRDR